MNPTPPAQNQRLQINAIGLAVLCALGLGAWFLHVGPLLSEARTHVRLKNDAAEKRRASSQIDQTMLSLGRKMEDLHQSLANGARQLEPAADLNRRLFVITELAGEAGLEIDRIDAQPAAALPRFQPIDIHLSARATYGQAIRFLQLAHDRLKHTGVTSVDLTAQPATGEVRCQLAVRFVWYAAPAVMPPAATAAVDHR